MPKAPAQASEWLEQQLEALDLRWVLVAVLTLVAVVYAPTLRYALVYDDGWVLMTNGFLREPDLDLLFSPRGAQLHVPDVFRPTSVLFDLLTYRMVGLHAGAHHAISILLHLGVCALGYSFARRIGVPPVLALAATAVFGTMGLHAEVVSLVSYREDMLALGLGLAAMLAASDALRQSGAKGPGSMLAPALAATVLMALAAGAKLSVAGLPLVWALAEHRGPGVRGRRVALVALLLVGVALALWQRSLVLGGIDPYAMADNPRVLASRAGVPFAEIHAASAQIHLAYLGQMLLPVGLSPEYTDFHAPWSAPASVFAAAGLAAVAAMAVGSLRRGPRLVGLCLISAALLAAPTSNVLGMPNMRADRFAYASSLPIALLIAAAALALGRSLARAERPPWIVLTPLLAVVLVQGSLAIAANSAYQSNRTLWATAVKRAPHSARARAMFGLMRLGTAGHRLKADAKLQARVLADCERAEALDALDEHAHLCHARLAAALSDWPEARRRFLRAIEIAPDHEGPWIAALAQAELEQLKEPGRAGRQQDPQITAAALARSQAWIDRGLAEYPYLAEVHLVAARLQQRRGNADLARTELGRARSLRPERWETVLALVELELDLGHVPGAYAIWRQEAMVLDGADPVARDHLLRRIRDAKHLGLRADPQIPQAQPPPTATNPAP